MLEYLLHEEGMPMKRSLLPAVMLLAGCAVDPHSGARAAPRPVVIQTVAAFNRPESVAFSLDGKTLFVNMQRQGLTVAITGPWGRRA